MGNSYPRRWKVRDLKPAPFAYKTTAKDQDQRDTFAISSFSFYNRNYTHCLASREVRCNFRYAQELSLKNGDVAGQAASSPTKAMGPPWTTPTLALVVSSLFSFYGHVAWLHSSEICGCCIALRYNDAGQWVCIRTSSPPPMLNH